MAKWMKILFECADVVTMEQLKFLKNDTTTLENWQFLK